MKGKRFKKDDKNLISFLEEQEHELKKIKSADSDFSQEIKQIEDKIRNYKEKEKRSSKVNAIKRLIIILIIVSAISTLVATRLVIVLKVNGNSMEPTLKEGEILITSKYFKYSYGDIIAFYYNGKILIKRVIATGGDVVNIDSNGNVFVNNKKLEENYVSNIDYGITDITFPIVVNENEVFVLGDNRKVSIDSRNKEIGMISINDIIGKIKIRLNPIKIY